MLPQCFLRDFGGGGGGQRCGQAACSPLVAPCQPPPPPKPLGTGLRHTDSWCGDSGDRATLPGLHQRGRESPHTWSPHFHTTSTCPIGPQALLISICLLCCPSPPLSMAQLFNKPHFVCCLRYCWIILRRQAGWWSSPCPAAQGAVPNSLPLAYLQPYVYLKCNINSPHDQSPGTAGLYGQSRELDCWQQ